MFVVNAHILFRVTLTSVLFFFQRYEEAAEAFKAIIKRDSSNAEAAHELLQVQIIQLMVKLTFLSTFIHTVFIFKTDVSFSLHRKMKCYV